MPDAGVVQDRVTGARLGLAMGLVPTVAACALGACGVACAPGSAFAVGEWVCLGAGTITGAGVAVWASDALGDLRGLGIAALVAGMTSALGCVGLGAGALLLVVAALVVSSALTWGTVRGFRLTVKSLDTPKE